MNRAGRAFRRAPRVHDFHWYHRRNADFAAVDNLRLLSVLFAGTRPPACVAHDLREYREADRMKHARTWILNLGAIVATLVLPATAYAQVWPTRPVTMVIPFAAGGPMDTVGRILAPRLRELLRQQVIIENIGGAGGMTGSARVAKAAPDGYQFVLGNVGTHAVSQTLYKKPRSSRSR
jgi:hypothetical protein